MAMITHETPAPSVVPAAVKAIARAFLRAQRASRHRLIADPKLAKRIMTGDAD